MKMFMLKLIVELESKFLLFFCQRLGYFCYVVLGKYFFFTNYMFLVFKYLFKVSVELYISQLSSLQNALHDSVLECLKILQFARKQRASSLLYFVKRYMLPRILKPLGKLFEFYLTFTQFFKLGWWDVTFFSFLIVQALQSGRSLSFFFPHVIRFCKNGAKIDQLFKNLQQEISPL